MSSAAERTKTYGHRWQGSAVHRFEYLCAQDGLGRGRRIEDVHVGVRPVGEQVGVEPVDQRVGGLVLVVRALPVARVHVVVEFVQRVGNQARARRLMIGAAETFHR